MITPEVVSAHNLTEEEFARIKELLGREPTHPELGIFSVMWSEHCSYKSSRVHLKRLPTTGERVIVPPGENAGVVDVGDGWCAAFKVESHNHPSFIEPFQGAATGVGGILRDIFTMGATAARLDELLALRLARRRKEREAQPRAPGRRGRRDRALRQRVRRGDRRRRGLVRRRLRAEPTRQRLRARPRAPRPNLFRQGDGRGQPRALRRREDRARRDSRGDDGVRRVRRGGSRKAADRAGGRPLSRKTFARSLPRSDAERRGRGDSGHGRGRADFVVLRDGGARGHRHRT